MVIFMVFLLLNSVELLRCDMNGNPIPCSLHELRKFVKGGFVPWFCV